MSGQRVTANHNHEESHVNTKTTQIKSDVLQALRAASICGNNVTLPPMSSALYKKARDVLEALGGPWNKKAQAHVFEDDPREALLQTVESGTYVSMADLRKLFGFFPTPAPLADRLVRAVGVGEDDVVLEPSAGDGALLKAVQRALDGKAPREVMAVELEQERHISLLPFSISFPQFSCWHGDFLQLLPQGPLATRVLMNPPFRNGVDATHILHAYDRWLAPGGKLAAIGSAGLEYRDGSAQTRVRELAGLPGGSITQLPVDSFKAVGTSVSTVLVILVKPSP